LLSLFYKDAAPPELKKKGKNHDAVKNYYADLPVTIDNHLNHCGLFL
jgi:hypothetical protein